MTLASDLLDRIRAALAAEVSRTSLRSVARQVEMSPSGLAKFLDGSSPYGPTQDRVRKWYVRHRPDAGDVDAETAAAALDLLIGPAVRLVPGLTSRFLDRIAEAYREAALPAPPWTEPDVEPVLTVAADA